MVWARGTTIALACAACPVALSAQELSGPDAVRIEPQLSRSDVAGARVEPEYSPVPLRAGSFTIRPAIAVVGSYDTNVLNRNNGEGDAAVIVRPSIVVANDTGRHLAQLRGTARLRRFADISSENSEEYALTARGRYDFDQGSDFSAELGYGRLIEERSSFGNIAGAAEPVAYDQLLGTVGASLQRGAFRIAPQFQFEERDFDAVDLIAGGQRNLDFRNTRRLGGSLGLGYAVSPRVSVFSNASYFDLEATDAAPGAQRDSTQVRVLAGIRGELSPLVNASVAVGYRERDFDLAAFNDFSGFTYEADLEWFATPLVTFTLEARQRYENSALQAVPGILTNRVTAQAYYDIRRNVRLAAGVGYENKDFRETDTTLDRPFANLQMQYQLSRHIAVGAYASLLHQDVSGAPLAQSFTSFGTGLGLSLTP